MTATVRDISRRKNAKDDVRRQRGAAFENLNATLPAGGCKFEDIVDCTTFHTDPEEQFETLLVVNNEIFKQAPCPNWTAIGVNWLAGFDFEIKVIVRVSS